jgi:hypothetical protein
MAISDDAAAWRIPYGSPVDGHLVAMTSAAGRFHAVLATGRTDDASASLAVWSSDDGTNWRLDGEQPSPPFFIGSLHEIALTLAGDRLLIVAGMEVRGPPFDLASLAMLGPVLER